MVNRNRRQVHAYNPNEIERLRRVPLPARLKCSMCNRSYNAANFSEKQLADVRWQLSQTSRITTNPKCVKCTGGQLVEMECTMCHTTKGLEGFAKVQRRKPDDAQCYACTDVQLAREPVNEERYEDPNKAFINTESSSGDVPEYWSSTNSARDTESSNGEWPDSKSGDGGRRRQEGGGIDLSTGFQQAMSLGGEVSDTLIDSEFSYQSGQGARPGSRSEASTKSWHTATDAVSNAGSTFNMNSYGRPSTQSASSSAYSFNSSIAERSQAASDQLEMKKGFAKVRAYASVAQVKPEPQLQQEDEFSGEEDSSSDDDDYSDDDTVI